MSDSHVRGWFVGSRGLRAGWSALLFVAAYLLVRAALFALLGSRVSWPQHGVIPLGLALTGEFAELLAVAVATFIMAGIERRSVLSYGFTTHRAIRLMLAGAATGFGLVSVMIFLLHGARLLVLGGPSLTAASAFQYAAAWGLMFVIVGLYEESLLRGYLQFTLTRGIGFWWAAFVLSGVFALGHLANGGETPLGLLEVAVTGMVFCLSLWYTKSLCWAVGAHAAWDWAESYFYGTANSGLVVEGRLFVSHPTGNPLWSGGSTGPEGSLLVLPVMLLLAAGMRLWWGTRRGAHGLETSRGERYETATQ